MKVRLLNSAMMPRAGRYTLRRLTPEEFGDHVAAAFAAGSLVSYVGYEQTAQVISDLASLSNWATRERIPIPVSREATEIEDGDRLLIAKLRYRVAAPATKGQQVDCHDFDYFAASYEEVKQWVQATEGE